MTEEYKKIIQKIDEAAQANDISRAEIARKLKTQREAVTRFFKCENVANFEKLQEYARAVNLELILTHYPPNAETIPNSSDEVCELMQKAAYKKIDEIREEVTAEEESRNKSAPKSADIPKEATKANANYLKIKGVSNVYKWSEGNIYKAQVFKNGKLNVEYFMTLDAAQTFLNSL